MRQVLIDLVLHIIPQQGLSLARKKSHVRNEDIVKKMFIFKISGSSLN